MWRGKQNGAGTWRKGTHFCFDEYALDRVCRRKRYKYSYYFYFSSPQTLLSVMLCTEDGREQVLRIFYLTFGKFHSRWSFVATYSSFFGESCGMGDILIALQISFLSLWLGMASISRKKRIICERKIVEWDENKRTNEIKNRLEYSTFWVCSPLWTLWRSSVN